MLFERAYTAAPLTLPAHASIFTGRYPPTHGVRDNGGFFLGPDETTLAERLQLAGFVTGGFVGAYVLDRRWGIGQGFDTYVDEFDTARAGAKSIAAIERRGDAVADRAIAWLRDVGEKRFFAWVHLYDAHTPYDPPEPYASQYASRPYDGEVAFADAQVGRILAQLTADHRLERTVVLVAADHGESLGEHGESTHGFFVYDAVIHVPFVLRTPCASLAGARIRDVVRTVDAVPTVLDLLGLPPAAGLDGASLVNLLGPARSAPLGPTGTTALGQAGTNPLGPAGANPAPRPAYAEALYARLHFGWSELRALVADRYKYIEAPTRELYDLEVDAGETTNLQTSRSALAAGLAQELGKMTADVDAAVRARASSSMDPETRERLAALGYIGAAPTSPTPSGHLADPKDKVDVFDRLTRAWELLAPEGASPEAVTLLRDVVRTDPAVTDAWFMLGSEAAARQRHADAIEHFRRALALKPDYDLVVRAMAKSFRALGRNADALAGYERLIALDPNNAFARHEMADILIDAKRYDEARRELEAALESAPTLAVARTSLGAVLLQLGDATGAERELRRALETRPDLPLAHFNLALIAESKGASDAAMAEYSAELERNPEGYRAAFNLGQLHGRLGNLEGQRAAYRRAIAINPRFAEGYFFLAKAYLDEGRDLAEAATLATRGLAVGPRSEMAPLGHFVLADVYTRQGRAADAARESAAGRALERSTRPAARR